MMIAMLLVTLAAQAADPVPQAAPGPVEVEIEATGTADAPAQGYLVSGWFPTRELPGGKKPVSAADRQAALRSIDLLHPVSGSPCGGVGTTMGFIGNEAVGGPSPDETEDEEGVGPITPYHGIFSSIDEARHAVAILRQAGATVFGAPGPILLKCDAVTQAAKIAAVSRSRPQADAYASLFGMRVTGVRRIGVPPANPFAALAESNARDTNVPDNLVRVRASVTVTYVLER